MHLSDLPSSLLSYLSQHTILPTNRSLQNSNVLPPGREGKHCGMANSHAAAPLALWDLAEAISITRSKISYSLIKHQPLLCAPACGYEFHALAVYPHPTFTTPPVSSAFWIRSEVCGAAFFAETVYVLRLLAVFAEKLHRWCFTKF